MSAAKQAEKSPFSEILGQSQVTRFLEQAAAENRLSHAYLFCGPVGSGKTEAALALALALLCPSKGCGNCDTCRRISRRTHPDVHWIEPDGVGSYLVEQIREMIADCSLSPIRANRKLYVITRADLLKGQSANAFLKTLEEPPASSSFVLLARNREGVLPTLVSRCQSLVFRHLPDEEAIGIVRRQTGADAQEATIALAASGGSTKKACEFLDSDSKRKLRLKTIDTIEKLANSDSLDVLEAAKELSLLVQNFQDEIKRSFNERKSAGEDFMSKGALNYLDKQMDRKIKSSTREGVELVLSVLASWLRDCLLVSTGMGDLKANSDCYYTIDKTGSEIQAAQVLDAMEALDCARSRISSNVSLQLVLETMLFDIREVLNANRYFG